MNKIFKITCFAIVLAVLITTNAFADDSMNASWICDYSNTSSPNVKISFTTPAKYVQQVTLVVYPFDKANSTENYIVMKEFAVNKRDSEEKVINFIISDKFSSESGKYVFILQGNGYLAQDSMYTGEVYVKNPMKTKDLLEKFNKADKSSIDALLKDVKSTLQLDDINEEQRTINREDIFCSIKNNDFGNGFYTLEDVRNAWKATDVILYLTENPTEVELENKIKKYCVEIGIDVNDDDFKKYENIVYKNIIKNAPLYNSSNGVMCISDLKNVVYRDIIVNLINDSEQDLFEKEIIKYKSYLSLGDLYINKFNGLSETSKEKVLRQIYKKNFKTAEELSATLKNAIDAEINNINEKTSFGEKESTGGGVGSKAGSYSISPGQTEVVPVDKKIVFSDLSSDNWAYSYICKLTEKGIVSGYSDNSFKPNNKVKREEFVKMIICASRLFDDNAVCNFEDVSENSWCYKYIASGVQNSIINGLSSERFGVGENITREDVAVILKRIFEKYNINTVSDEDDESNLFEDSEKISDYAADSIKELSKFGIINGYEDNTFRPQEFLSRAEAAKIITLFSEKL